MSEKGREGNAENLGKSIICPETPPSSREIENFQDLTAVEEKEQGGLKSLRYIT